MCDMRYGMWDVLAFVSLFHSGDEPVKFAQDIDSVFLEIRIAVADVLYPFDGFIAGCV